MDLASFIHKYGYLAVYIGGIFEGESVTLLGGLAAKQQWLGLPGVILSAQLGALTSDVFCFFCGRLYGARVLSKYPRLAEKAAKYHRMIEHHQTKLLLTFQFLPGTCTIVPLAFGTSKIPIARFLILDVIGSSIWAIALSSIGYLFGTAAQQLLARGQEYGIGIAVALCILAALFSRWRMQRAVRKINK